MMKEVFVISMAVLLLQSWSPSLADKPLAIFRGTMLSKDRLLTASKFLKFFPNPPGAPSIIVCSKGCEEDSRCLLWCHDASNSTCFMSNLIVMPNYEETNMSDAIPCFTRQQKDLATGAAIDGSPENPNLIERAKTNLVDGFYDKTLPQCYITKSLVKPWFMLDFGTSVSLYLVKLRVQETGMIAKLLYITNLEIRTGDVLPATPGDFSAFRMFGVFPGPPADFGQEINFSVKFPVTARFLSVQKVDDVKNPLQICHLEIY